ncbi:MAG: menaquinone biosynthesis protein [Phycisphaeraceae bacterium]|nr:MAG: menaquinone biosynthesis protein [Phycisphaeraceae bacterium]
MKPVRVGVVRYLNSAPLTEGLSGVLGLTLVPGAPSRMISMLERGEVDIALASIVDAATPPTPLTILPVGMIGCEGPTLTVRLFSDVPFGEIESLHADTESHTSVVLARLLLRERFARDPRVVEFDARERVEVAGGGGEEWPTTLLMIGDKVVTSTPPDERYPHRLDLGEAWHGWTGLPFVYAAWMCRAEHADDPRIVAAASLLERQLTRNLARLDWIIRERAPEHRWPVDLAEEYLGRRLRYLVGERERAGAQRFIDAARAAGLLPRVAGSPPALPWAAWTSPSPTGSRHAAAAEA